MHGMMSAHRIKRESEHATRFDAGLVFCCGFVVSAGAAEDPKVAGACMTCHKEKTPGLYKQWFDSEHAAHNVTCLSCHQAQRGDKDAYQHYDALIATLVTPADCGRCHAQREPKRSATPTTPRAGKILDSADAYLAHVAAGDPVAIIGCESCHGAKVEIDPNEPQQAGAAQLAQLRNRPHQP